MHMEYLDNYRKFLISVDYILFVLNLPSIHQRNKTRIHIHSFVRLSQTSTGHNSHHVVTSGILHVLHQHKAFSQLTSLSMSMSRSSSLMSSEMLLLAAGGRLSCSFIKVRSVQVEMQWMTNILLPCVCVQTRHNLRNREKHNLKISIVNLPSSRNVRAILPTQENPIKHPVIPFFLYGTGRSDGRHH